MMELDKFLTIQEASTRYRTSDDTLYRLMRQGRLTRHKRPSDKRTWVPVAELEAVLGKPSPAT